MRVKTKLSGNKTPQCDSLKSTFIILSSISPQIQADSFFDLVFYLPPDGLTWGMYYVMLVSSF